MEHMVRLFLHVHGLNATPSARPQAPRGSNVLDYLWARTHRNDLFTVHTERLSGPFLPDPRTTLPAPSCYPLTTIPALPGSG